MPRISRSIHFYQIVERVSEAPLNSVDILAILNELNTICRAPRTAYLDTGNSEVSRPWVDDHTTFPLKIRFGKTRKAGLPQIEGMGNFRPIEVDDTLGEGVNDLSHIALFRNGVVGHEFNWHAPRLGTLAYYINQKTAYNVKFIPLLNTEAAQRLEQLDELYSFNLKVKSDQLDELRTASAPLKEAIGNLSEFSNNQTIEVCLRADRRAHESLPARVLNAARSLVRHTGNDSLKKLVVSGMNGETGKIDEIDLLREFLVAKKEVIQADDVTRSIDSDSAYRAIESAYRDKREAIRGAIGDAD